VTREHFQCSVTGMARQKNHIMTLSFGVGDFVMDAQRMNKAAASLMGIMKMWNLEQSSMRSFTLCLGAASDPTRRWCESTITSLILFEEYGAVSGR